MNCINCDETHEFLGFSACGAELHSDQAVYSRKLFWSITEGSQVRDRYGIYRVSEGNPQNLHTCKARKNYKCSDCGQRIDKGQWHASATYYDHYCLGCVEVKRPETQWHV